MITNNVKYEWRLDEEQVIEEDEESEGEQHGEEIEDALLNHIPPVPLLQAIEGEEESEDESNGDRDGMTELVRRERFDYSSDSESDDDDN